MNIIQISCQNLENLFYDWFSSEASEIEVWKVILETYPSKRFCVEKTNRTW